MTNIKENPKVAIYVRTSTREQRNGIDVQRATLLEYCDKRNWSVDEENIYTDEEYSGHTLSKNRPALKKLFEDIAQQKYNVLLVYRLDRLSRNRNEIAELLQKLSEDDIELKSITESFHMCSGNLNKYSLQILSHFAELETQKVKEKLEQK